MTPIERRRWQAVWRPERGEGLEHCVVTEHQNEYRADGTVLGVERGVPFTCRYSVRCDRQWRTRHVRVRLRSIADHSLELVANGHGEWHTLAGERLDHLAGCIDVDLAVTPFTNTLPIRRLRLEPDEMAELQVAYVSLPELEERSVLQRYTCLEHLPLGALYRYEGLFRGFAANLPVDQEGLVLDYPETFRRVWPPTTGSSESP